MVYLMAEKNEVFTNNLLFALKTKGINYEKGKKTGLKKFAKDNNIVYTTLHKCLREDMYGHVPEWDQLLKISKAVDRSIDWLLTGKETDLDWPEYSLEYCEKLKNILKNGEDTSIKAIKDMIDLYAEKTEKTQKNAYLEKTGT